MKKRKIHKKIISVFLTIVLLTNPIKLNAFPFLISGLVVALTTVKSAESSANNLVGEANQAMKIRIEQVEELITEKLEEIKRIQEKVKDDGLEIMDAMESKLEAQVKNLNALSNKLLLMVNDMVEKNVQCIDQKLAERINQLFKGFDTTLEQFDKVLSDSIDKLYIATVQVEKRGINDLRALLDDGMIGVFKIAYWISLIIGIVMTIAVWLFTNRKKAIILSVFSSILIAASLILLFNKSNLTYKLFGHTIELPDKDNSCIQAEEAYRNHVTNAPTLSYNEFLIDNSRSIDLLNWCLYTHSSGTDFVETKSKIDFLRTIRIDRKLEEREKITSVKINCNKKIVDPIICKFGITKRDGSFNRVNGYHFKSDLIKNNIKKQMILKSRKINVTSQNN